MMDLITFNEASSTPKYQQIVGSIVNAIVNKDALPGQRLPSIHEVSARFDIAKRTVEKAYDFLKEKEYIVARQGKGYYVNFTQIGRTFKVFLLFNKLSAHKQLIYEAFIHELGLEATVDFFIYNNNFGIFKKIMEQETSNYTHYVIIAHFFESSEKATEIIDRLPKHKLILLDKLIDGVTGEYAAVYQNFEKDLVKTLKEALPLLRKYSTLNILFPSYSYQPKAILDGFYKFCAENDFRMRVVHDIEKEVIKSENAYINLMEEDLVTLIKKAKNSNLKIGQEVGILSYNETPLKEVLLDGITVISTDFPQMGKTAAQLILTNRRDHIENPFRLIIRNSL